MAEMSLGKAYVQIVPSAEHISGNISKVLAPEATAAGEQAGEKITTSMSEKIKNSGEKLKSAGATLTKSLTVPIVGGFAASAKLASDYGENLNKIDVAFGSSAKVVRAWSDNAREQFGLSKVAASDAVSAFGALGKGIGLSETDAAKMSTTLAGLSADLGSYFNTSNAEASKALEGIFTGESEALKKFGVVMTDTNLEKFASDQGLVWKEMDQSQKTTLRYQYVLAKTKDAQGDYARTSDGTANSIKTFKAALEDLGTVIGEKLLPILTPIIQKVTTWIDKFSQLSPTAQKVILIIGGIAAALGPVLTIVGTILTVVPMIGGAMTALAGPVGIVIGVLAGLVLAGIAVYKNWDKIKAFAGKVKDAVIRAFTKLKDTLVGVFKAIGSALMAPFKKAWEFIKGIVKKIKDVFKFKVSLPKIKLPHFKVDPPGWKLSDLLKGSIPSLGIDWYAKGGIVDRPTVLGAGDVRGGEGIVPLNPFWAKLDQMADSIVSGVATVAAAGAGGGDVVIENYMFKNGPQMGETIVKSYDVYKKRLGGR